MTMRSKQWYTKTSRLEYSFAKSSIGRRPSNRSLTTRSSDRRPVESKFQISLASLYHDLSSRKIGVGGWSPKGDELSVARSRAGDRSRYATCASLRTLPDIDVSPHSSRELRQNAATPQTAETVAKANGKAS